MMTASTAPRILPRVLIADDNELNRKILSKQLDKLGFVADAVISGGEAVTSFAGGHYGLVFMDVNMGDMDGYQATGLIRSHEARPNSGPDSLQDGRTPIIAVTANNDLEERTRCLSSGMDDFLAKPIRLADLAKLLVRWGACNLPVVVAGSAPLVIADGTMSWLQRLERSCVAAGLAAEIIEDYQDHGPARLRRLHNALQRGDGAKAERERFALLMNSRGVGALRVVQTMELFPKATTTADRRQLVELAKDELTLALATLVNLAAID